LLYVSRAALPAPTGCDEVADILDGARLRNQALGITGALIFTGEHFAQLLEGRGDAIGRLMKDIERDPRHTDVRIVQRENDVDRVFDRWSMAYAGPSIFIARHIRVLTAIFSTPNSLHVTRLVDLMISLCKQPELTGGISNTHDQ
jgi:hypothetical protein